MNWPFASVDGVVSGCLKSTGLADSAGMLRLVMLCGDRKSVTERLFVIPSGFWKLLGH